MGIRVRVRVSVRFRVGLLERCPKSLGPALVVLVEQTCIACKTTTATAEDPDDHKNNGHPELLWVRIGNAFMGFVP